MRNSNSVNINVVSVSISDILIIIMSYSLSLQDYIRSYHPSKVPVSSQTAYTSQYIKSAEDYEQELRDIYRRVSGFRRQNSVLSAKMDGFQGEEETAFLIEKTNQQSFVTLLAGTILTGLIYTALLILKPTDTCAKELRNDPRETATETVEMVSKSLVLDSSEEKSVTTNGLACHAASQPLLTTLAIVWIPILVFTVITGYMVRNVAVGNRVDDQPDDEVRTNIVIDMDAETLQRLLEKQRELEILSRLDKTRLSNLRNISF